MNKNYTNDTNKISLYHNNLTMFINNLNFILEFNKSTYQFTKIS